MSSNTVPEYDLEAWLVCAVCGHDEVRFSRSRTEDGETTYFYKCTKCAALLRIPPEE